MTTSLPDGQAGALETLIARLETATGWDYRLDAEIAQAIGWTSPGTRFVEWWRDPDGRQHTAGPPHYTTSIDAALTLVPEGAVWHIMIDYGGLNRAKIGPHAAVYHDDDPPRLIQADAATPALALCIAALLARAASPTNVASVQDAGEVADEPR